MIDSFINGSNIKDISISYDFSVTTITRQLKKALGDKKFNEIKKSKNKGKFKIAKEQSSTTPLFNEMGVRSDEKIESLDENIDASNFVELKPLFDGIELDKQKDISSKPLKNIKFPKTVYLIVDKEIELVPKLLNDYPEWRFLPNEDQNRYTIEIFSEQKEAKIKCQKNQKILKIPNPKVFLIASRSLIIKGITRIIFGDLLIAIE